MRRVALALLGLVGLAIAWREYRMSTLRSRIVAMARSLLGVPYRWGGDDPATGLDCSGFVIYVLSRTGVVPAAWQATHTAHRLWSELPPVERPRPGDLAFYGRSGIASHVMMVDAGGGVIGASGGDSTTTTIEAARARGAAVKQFSRPDYRGDLLGFRGWPT